MRITRLMNFAGVILACLFIAGIQTTVSAQGRGGGGGRGGGMGGGRPAGVGGGPSMGSPGVDRGLGTASDRSNGRSDRGLGTASTNSRGRSDDGLNRARMARENSRRADDDLREHPGLPRMLHTSARDLRSQYEEALLADPDLKFGQFVAATMLSRNLGARNPAITREAILNGLADGDSIGRTLQNLGLSSREAKEAEKRAEREIKEGRQGRS